MTTISINNCRCGSGKQYAECCEKIIKDPSCAENVEQLMRSRYTAYTQDDMAYIKQTMSGNALKQFEKNRRSGWEEPTKWLKLVVHSSKTLKKRGYVEFSATYMREGKKLTMKEHSVFKKINGCWYYVDRI